MRGRLAALTFALAASACSPSIKGVDSAVLEEAVGSVIGIGGMLGAVGGMVFSKYIGAVLEDLGTYTPIFVIAASAYLLALLVVHILTPKMEPVKL